MDSKNIFRQIWWQLAIFVIVSSLAALVGQHFKEKFGNYMPETVINRSSLNKKASGTSGLYELCQAVGFKSHRWKLPYRDLKDIRGQLIIIGPRQSLDKYELDAILNWVKKGNYLVYLDEFSNPYSQNIVTSLGLWTTNTKTQDIELSVEPNLPVTRYVQLPRGSYSTALSTGYDLTPILRHEKDIVLAEKKFGTGTVLIGTTANLVSNLQFKDNGTNFQLICNWLRLNNLPLYFDERCHGLTQGKNLITTISSGTLGLFFLQLLVIFGLAVASHHQRFGQTLAFNNQRKISNLEYVDGIANSYRRARATHLASNILSHNLRLKLAKDLGQSTGDDEVLAGLYISRLATKSGNFDEERARLIKTLSLSKTAPERRNISEQELLLIKGYCDKIQETLLDPQFKAGPNDSATG